MEQTTYYRYLTATEEVTADYNDSGKAVAGTERRNKFWALDKMELSEDEKTAIFLTDIDTLEREDGSKKYQEAIDEGVSLYDYIRFAAETGAITSDKDSCGNTVTNSKKKKVLDYIDGMDLSRTQKDALYYAAGYGESTISDAPWRGGSVSTGSGGKRAKKKAQKVAALARATKSPAVREYLRKYGGGAMLPRAGETPPQRHIAHGTGAGCGATLHSEIRQCCAAGEVKTMEKGRPLGRPCFIILSFDNFFTIRKNEEDCGRTAKRCR